MKVNKEEKIRQLLMSQFLNDRRALPTSYSPKVKLVHIFWYLYPLALYYAWKDVIW